MANLPSAETAWAGEKYVMEKVGYKVIYDQTYGVAQTNFDQNVVAMKNAGVKILFVDSMAESYASALLKSLQTQDFHPVVVLGAATYTNKLIPDSGGPSAVNGDYLQQSTTLYLGQDASTVPAVASFLHWVNVASPGFTPDLYTLYGWLSAQLFAQALQNAGTEPEPRLAADAAGQDHVVRRPAHHRAEQRGSQDARQLLHHRAGGERQLAAPGRPARQRPGPRVPLRLLVRHPAVLTTAA